MENKCPAKFHQVDFCAPATHDNPYEMYDYFLEHEPVYFDEKNEIWEVFRYDDIVTIERDTETFISGEGVRPGIPPDPGMIYQDGEQHSKQRALVSSGFTPRQMRKMEDRAREIVVELVDKMLAKDEGGDRRRPGRRPPRTFDRRHARHSRREAAGRSWMDQHDHRWRLWPRIRHGRGQ